MKVLGLEWTMHKDTINISCTKRSTAESTKRDILKATAEVFDPLGLFMPVTLQSKLLLRELWEEDKGWDDPITNLQQQRWGSISKDLEELHTIELP